MPGQGGTVSRRKYALTRIAAGDYLLLANDGKTVWRLATYTEDGSAIGNRDKPLTGTFWGTWLYTGRDAVIDPGEWNDFEMRECLLRSRRDAIASVLGDGAA